MTFKNILTEIKNHREAIVELENQAIKLLQASKKIGVHPITLIPDKVVGYNVGFLDNENKIVDFIAFEDTEREAWLEAVYCCDGVSTFSLD